jgi:hypothetical protein
VPRFELDRLTSYDEESLLSEVRRVARLVASRTLTEAAFNESGRVHSSTLRKRFGAWRDVLAAAGLSDRHDGRTSAKQREEVLAEIRRVAAELGTREVRRREFTERSGITDRPIRRLFGSWPRALAAAQVDLVSPRKLYTDEECFENLLAVWTHYGRAPRHSEMSRPPSIVGAKAYVRRWETWRKALAAFVERVNSEPMVGASPSPDGVSSAASPQEAIRPRPAGDTREVSLGLRYRVLVRDRFRCVLCGRSPASDLGVVLHVDHILPWSRGGKTVVENLRSLCEVCNLGKGSRLEPNTGAP